MLDEFGDIDAGGQFDQPLFEPHQQVIDLGGFRLGLLRRNLADHHEMLFAVEPENDPVSTRAFLKTGHWTTPMPRQCCCQIVAKSPLKPKNKGLRRIDVTPYPAKCRREDLNLHGHG